MKINTIKILITFFIFVSLIFYATSVYAIGFASAIGTENYTSVGSILSDKNGESTITTTPLINTAANYYDSCGYTNSRRIIDPSYTLLVSNIVGAEIQLYATHGSLDSVSFKSPVGIKTGATKMVGQKEFFGTDDALSAWNKNTILVMYLACNTAGENGAYSEDSITYKTVADGGPIISIGFTRIIYYSDLEKWSNRLHTYLASGHGVEESARYANTFNDYKDNGIKDWLLIGKSSSYFNIKIGYYRTRSEVSSIRSSYVEKRVDNRNLIGQSVEISNDDVITSIINELKKIDGFEKERYEYQIHKSTMIGTEDNSNKEIQYVDAIFKVGDFYTDAGYTVLIENDKIIGIYDNNIDIEKQRELLNDENNFIISSLEITNENLINKAISSYNSDNSNAFNDVVQNQNEKITYYYDMINNKKYIQIPVISKRIDINGKTDIAVDKINYEI